MYSAAGYITRQLNSTVIESFEWCNGLLSVHQKSLSSPEIFFIQEKQPAIDLILNFCSGSCIVFGLVIFEPIYESLNSYHSGQGYCHCSKLLP